MSDITFSIPQSLPEGWSPIAQNANRQLSILKESRHFPVKISSAGGIAAALLTRTISISDLLNHLRLWKSDFIGHIGVTAGVIWNTSTGEYCIFRDAFGFIPWMICRPLHPQNELDFSATTSPFVQDLWTHSRNIRHTWLGNFLLERDTDSLEDIFEGTERILPGEFICACHRDFDSFIENLTHPQASPSEPCHLIRKCLWHHKNYSTITDTRTEIADELRSRIMKAVQRIPDDNPCFTLSGGLDSTGILSSWCSMHSGRYDAVSLISKKHSDCDESTELDVLEKSFPIHLTRIDMDRAWPLSMPNLYSDYRAYGPFVTPGIESMLACYNAVETESGPRTIVTGYGGNFIVKVRPDALIRSLIHEHQFRRLSSEIRAMKREDVRYQAVRFLANSADGQIRILLRNLLRRRNTDTRYSLLNSQFRSIFPAIASDPFYAMTHQKERTQIPIYWSWELRARSLDIIARTTPHFFYDPLFDIDVYDYCACIPPEYFLSCGEYRPIYKEALLPLLPPQIIHHPKCQCYDSLMNDGLCLFACDILKKAIHSNRMTEFIDVSKLANLYDQYCCSYQNGQETNGLNELWPALSTLLWSASL